MKSEIMKLANQLCEALDNCSDGEFVDDVIYRVSCNDPFDESEIFRAEDEEYY